MSNIQELGERLTEIIDTQSILASAEFDLSAFMQIVVNRMQAMTPATGAVVELVQGDEMVYEAASGTLGPYVGTRLPKSKSLSGMCVADREVKIANDTASDARVDAAACAQVGAASMICVPLFRRGESVGVLKVASSKVSAFSERDVLTLQLMAGMLGGALGQQLEVDRRKELEEKLRYMAHHDALTGLPNRALFYDRLRQAVTRSVRNKTLVALYYVDVDDFKPVNDNYGHDTGDALLCGFVDRIRSFIRASDTFARLGGDEFVLIAEDFRSSLDIESLAEKILKSAREEFRINGATISVSASIGVAVSDSVDVDIDKFVQRADAALYKVKVAGRNNFEINR